MMNRRFHRWLDKNEMWKMAFLLAVVVIFNAALCSGVRALILAAVAGFAILGMSRWLYLRD